MPPNVKETTKLGDENLPSRRLTMRTNKKSGAIFYASTELTEVMTSAKLPCPPQTSETTTSSEEFTTFSLVLKSFIVL